MKNFIILFGLLIIAGCSEAPTDVPVGTILVDVELRVDMNSMITGQDSPFDTSVDVLKVLLDGTEEYEMTDDDNDNVFNCIITNLILSRTYSYQYMINDVVEDLLVGRSFTVFDDNNILDYYGELNPTTLTFLVDMSYQIELGNFSQAVNSINIVGNLNGWAGEEMVLSDGDEGVYQILITDIEIGDEIIYKFRIDSNDWESPNFDLSSCIDDGYGGCNRFHVVEEGEHILNHQFNDEYGD